VTAALLAGAGVGLAIWLLWTGLSPARQPLSTALDRIGQPLPATTGQPETLDARLGGALRRIPVVERSLVRMRADFRVLHKDPDEAAAQLVAYAFAGFLGPVVVMAGGIAMGLPIPWAIPPWLGLVGAAAALLLPYRDVRERAAEARAGFSHALSAYCDVCAMAMAAGREVYAAMFEAASVGHGWAFDEIDGALRRGFLAGDKPWDSLIALGHDLGIEDLAELGATIALAGGEGAAVRDTVASKARSIRERLVAAAEKKAGAATERMAVPGTLLLIGFLWFLTYPALFVILQQSRP
jgi:Flp pilus assembly protein TadB